MVAIPSVRGVLSDYGNSRDSYCDRHYVAIPSIRGVLWVQNRAPRAAAGSATGPRRHGNLPLHRDAGSVVIDHRPTALCQTVTTKQAVVVEGRCPAVSVRGGLPTAYPGRYEPVGRSSTKADPAADRRTKVGMSVGPVMSSAIPFRESGRNPLSSGSPFGSWITRTIVK